VYVGGVGWEGKLQEGSSECGRWIYIVVVVTGGEGGGSKECVGGVGQEGKVRGRFKRLQNVDEVVVTGGGGVVRVRCRSEGLGGFEGNG
jgi:hypothetical protein